MISLFITLSNIYKLQPLGNSSGLLFDIETGSLLHCEHT